MHVSFFTASRTGFAGHILCKDSAQRHSANEESAHIAVRWTNDVVRPQINTATHRDGFLTAADVHSADDLSLPIELPLDPEFELARQLHVIQHVEQALVGRNIDRR